MSTNIYGPQNFNVATGSISIGTGGYHSTAGGGADAPIAGFPEFMSGESVKNQGGAGPSGQDALVENGVDDFRGAQLLGLGSGPAGVFDLRDLGTGKFHAKVYVKFSSADMINLDYGAPLILVAGRSGNTDDGQTNTWWVVTVEQFGDGGVASFQWDLTWRAIRADHLVFETRESNGSLDSSPGVADDQWHLIEIEVVPSTVTGVFNGSGAPGTATSAEDGSLKFWLDGVLQFQNTATQLIVNRIATTEGNKYLGRGVWFGDSSFGSGADWAGPHTGLELFYSGATPPTTPPPTLVNSVPSCCSDEVKAAQAVAKVKAIGPYWTPSCPGGGVVPTSSDLRLTELWDY